MNTRKERLPLDDLVWLDFFEKEVQDVLEEFRGRAVKPLGAYLLAVQFMHSVEEGSDDWPWDNLLREQFRIQPEFMGRILSAVATARSKKPGPGRRFAELESHLDPRWKMKLMKIGDPSDTIPLLKEMGVHQATHSREKERRLRIIRAWKAELSGHLGKSQFLRML
jgi:hypothetical protein